MFAATEKYRAEAQANGVPSTKRPVVAGLSRSREPFAITLIAQAGVAGSGFLLHGGTNPTKIIGLAEADGPQATDSQTKIVSSFAGDKLLYFVRSRFGQCYG